MTDRPRHQAPVRRTLVIAGFPGDTGRVLLRVDRLPGSRRRCLVCRQGRCRVRALHLRPVARPRRLPLAGQSARGQELRAGWLLVPVGKVPVVPRLHHQPAIHPHRLRPARGGDARSSAPRQRTEGRFGSLPSERWVDARWGASSRPVRSVRRSPPARRSPTMDPARRPATRTGTRSSRPAASMLPARWWRATRSWPKGGAGSASKSSSWRRCPCERGRPRVAPQRLWHGGWPPRGLRSG